MLQLQCQPSQPLLPVGSLPEKTLVARLRLQKVYNLRLEYASYTPMGLVFAFSRYTSIPGVLYNLVPAWPPRIVGKRHRRGAEGAEKSFAGQD